MVNNVHVLISHCMLLSSIRVPHAELPWWRLCSYISAIYEAAMTNGLLDTPLHGLFTKQSSHSSQYTVLFWVVWVVFARYLQYRRKGIGKAVHLISYFLSNLPCSAH